MLNAPRHQFGPAGMRVHRFIVVGLAALVLSGCAGMPRKKTGVVPPPPALRTTIAEVRAPVVPVATVVAQPVVVPAAVMAPAPNYVLDSGDRLRILVFGQEGLSNTYAVDADG